MERLKTELLMIGKEKGDTGTTAQQREWIDNYMVALQRHITERGIKSFTAVQLRDPYVEYVKVFLVNGSLEEAAESVVLFFHTKRHLRERNPVNITVNSSVVDIFKKRS